jgi:hypothetical protein
MLKYELIDRLYNFVKGSYCVQIVILLTADGISKDNIFPSDISLTAVTSNAERTEKRFLKFAVIDPPSDYMLYMKSAISPFPSSSGRNDR